MTAEREEPIYEGTPCQGCAGARLVGPGGWSFCADCLDGRSRLRRDVEELAGMFERFARSSAALSCRPGDYEAGRSCSFELAADELRRALARPARPGADDGEE